MSEAKENYTGRIHEHPNAGKGNFAVNPGNINRKGRPRQLASDVIKQLRKNGVENVSQAEIVDVYLSLMNLEIEEVDAIVDDRSVPALVRIIAREMLSGKGFEIIEKMLDRAIGKVTSKIEHSGNISSNDSPLENIRTKLQLDDRPNDKADQCT